MTAWVVLVSPACSEATSEEMAVRIFDPFYTTKAGGVGMGLAICRSLIESQGGQLWVDRSGDRGVAFLFTLPFAE